jgi:ribosome-associated toxin RatA of RatAB toxin-antitoxin module
MVSRLCFCLMMTAALPALARPALDVSVVRLDGADGKVYQISARGEVAAAPGAVWRILTDYERMAEFVPDLHRTRVISRSGDEAVIEQFGEARLLFLRREIRLVVQVREQPISQIDISLVDGDMKVYRCTWKLVPVPETGGTRVFYSGTVAPKFYVPGMLGSNLIRGDIEAMMTAVMKRLDRPE